MPAVEVVPCSTETITDAIKATGTYTPSPGDDFIRIEQKQLFKAEEPYLIQGVNYYPAQYPWRRFLTETDTSILDTEFELLRAANFNTLRIFLWQYALFICPGNDAVPHTPHIQRLDTIIQTAARYGFHLIVTLNDVPDLDNEPLYANPIRAQNELRFIVERYRNEPAILAWDLRNEGDIDYGTHPHIRGKFSKEQVLKWLGETSDFVRTMDNRHLITAGWLYDAEATTPYVDFISFHHWTTPDELKNRIQAIRAVSDKPILLEETGYSTFQADITPEIQAQRIRTIIETTRQENLIGWMIWTAFDFPITAACYPSPCTSSDSLEHHFGIWYSDYTEKPAVAVIRDMAK